MGALPFKAVKSASLRMDSVNSSLLINPDFSQMMVVILDVGA